MSQEYHKMHKKSWTCDECICISVRTGTHNSRVIVSHSSILHIILNLLALCLCHKDIETLICTGDLGPHWNLGAVGRLMYKPLCCSAVVCALFELDQPDLSPAAPSSGLLSQSWCSWRWKCVRRRPGPPSISHLGGGGASCLHWHRVHKAAGSRGLGLAKDCMSMSRLQVSKLLGSSESVEGEENDLINSLLKACSSSN